MCIRDRLLDSLAADEEKDIRPLTGVSREERGHRQAVLLGEQHAVLICHLCGILPVLSPFLRRGKRMAERHGLDTGADNLAEAVHDAAVVGIGIDGTHSTHLTG